MKAAELPDGRYGLNKNFKLLALKCLMYVGEVVLSILFEVLLKGEETFSPFFQGPKVRVCQTKTVDPNKLKFQPRIV